MSSMRPPQSLHRSSNKMKSRPKPGISVTQSRSAPKPCVASIPQGLYYQPPRLTKPPVMEHKMALSMVSSSRQSHQSKSSQPHQVPQSELKPRLKSSQLNSSQEQSSLMTPKFQQFSSLRQPDIALPPPTIKREDSSKEYRRSVNGISSKQKPTLRQSSRGSQEFDTPKKSQTGRVDKSSANYLNVREERDTSMTVKKKEKSFGVNPTSHFQHGKSSRVSKMSRGSFYTSDSQQGKKPLKIEERFRYCVGCEVAVLQSNIIAHQQECPQFQSISSLPDQGLLDKVKEKIGQIEEKIGRQSGSLSEEMIAKMKEGSSSLVQQSRARPSCSPGSRQFAREYDRIMGVGRQWCAALEEVNKLRWFTVIAHKLESKIKP